MTLVSGCADGSPDCTVRPVFGDPRLVGKNPAGLAAAGRDTETPTGAPHISV
jgi:hypothetical protein